MAKARNGAEPSFKDVARLLEKGSCVLCSLLKRFQSACIQNASADRVQHLCSFHTWALAGAANTDVAAGIFLHVLELREMRLDIGGVPRCSLCEQIAEEEAERSNDFVLLLKNAEFRAWLDRYGALCVPHASRLLKRVPTGDRAVLTSLVQNTAARLKGELRCCTGHPEDRRSASALSRAAEYLEGRRGLAIKDCQ